jgi:preprotein translocase subunit YajC
MDFSPFVSFFISDALAQTGQASGTQQFTSIAMMVGLFVIFYLLLIRPEQKRRKEHQNMVAGLTKGDEIVTMGGMLGKITAVGDNFLTVQVAKDIEIKIQKMSVQAMMPKGTYK